MMTSHLALRHEIKVMKKERDGRTAKKGKLKNEKMIW